MFGSESFSLNAVCFFDAHDLFDGITRVEPPQALNIALNIGTSCGREPDQDTLIIVTVNHLCMCHMGKKKDVCQQLICPNTLKCCCLVEP